VNPAIRERLHRVVDPCSIATGVPISIIDMGLVLSADVVDRTATITVQLTSPFCMQIGLITERIRSEVSALDEIDEVTVDVDHSAEWLPSMVDAGARERLRERRPFPVIPVVQR
jgi:metal-sulfur cluster biosynthetic enzyme